MDLFSPLPLLIPGTPIPLPLRPSFLELLRPLSPFPGCKPVVPPVCSPGMPPPLGTPPLPHPGLCDWKPYRT